MIIVSHNPIVQNILRRYVRNDPILVTCFWGDACYLIGDTIEVVDLAHVGDLGFLLPSIFAHWLLDDVRQRPTWLASVGFAILILHVTYGILHHCIVLRISLNNRSNFWFTEGLTLWSARVTMALHCLVDGAVLPHRLEVRLVRRIYILILAEILHWLVVQRWLRDMLTNLAEAYMLRIMV